MIIATKSLGPFGATQNQSIRRFILNLFKWFKDKDGNGKLFLLAEVLYFLRNE